MPASKKDKEQKMVDLKITVENHTHEGELCMKGSTIKVVAETAAMLTKAWKKEEDREVEA